jgi:flagellar motor protein MotB
MSYNARDDEEDLENLLNKGALWAVTYGDLMSYLMIFFLIMFTFSLKGKKAASGIEALQTHFGGQKDSKSMQRLDQRQKEEG